MRAVVWVFGCMAAAYAQTLPHVDTAAFAPAIKAQIEQAEVQAKLHPNDPKMVGAYGMVLDAYEQRAAAAEVYARAAVLDPKNFAWAYLLGKVELERGLFKEGAGHLQAALLLDPTSTPAQLALAQAEASLANWERAEASYRGILAAHPDIPQAWYGLGRVQSAKQDHAQAAESFAKACALFPAYGAAQFALAGELRKMRRNAEAAEHFQLYTQNRDVEPAFADPVTQEVRRLNQSSTVHFERAAQLEKEGKLPEAIREQQAVLDLDANNEQAHINLISLYARIGAIGDAKQHFERAVRLDSGRADAWYNYGVLLFNQRQWQEAASAFLHALQINPHYAEAHNNLGAVYELQGNFADAITEFRAAIDARPDYPLARFHLARLLVNQGQYAEAEQQLLRAVQSQDENTPMYTYALAATYARDGKREEALRYYQQAHDRAAAKGQTQLLASIDREMQALSAQQ